YRLSYGVRWADVDASYPGPELVVVGDSADDTATGYGINYVYGYDAGAQEFVQTAYFTTPYQLVRVEPGDYDGDGDVDLIASTNAINAPCPVSLFRNDGGQFTGQTSGGDDHSVECLGQDATAALATADYDRDGDLDLVLGDFPDGLLLLVNIGDGGVVTDSNPFDVEHAVEIEGGLEYIPYDVAWGDFDQDGHLDLAAAYPLQREVRLYRGAENGSPTLFTQTLHTTPFMTPLAVDWADFDGDGRLDLAVGDSPVRIYGYLAASNVFTPLACARSLPLNRGQVWSLRGVDVSNQGDMQLALSNRDGSSHLFTTVSPRLKRTVTPAGMAQAGSVAWGDEDGDGYLDLLLGAPPVESNSGLFLNRNGEFDTARTFRHSGYGPHAVAFGDVTGDGRLDVAIGTPTDLQVYYNGNYDGAPDWRHASASIVRALAWGDTDDDGHLDLLVGLDDGTVALYVNAGDELASTPAFTVAVGHAVRAVAWGDFDNDYYLDFAVGVDGGPARVYRNRGDGGFSLAWESPDQLPTRALAWGDYDGDGDLDLAVGNYGERDQVWQNRGGAFPSQPVWTSDEADETTSLAWGDWDSDGDLDLAVGRDGQPDVVYANLGSPPDAPNLAPLWLSAESQATTGVAWGDRDGDGDLDLAVSQRGAGGESGYYENTLAAPAHLAGAEPWAATLPNNPPHLYVARPGATDDAYFYSAPEVLAGPGVPTVTVHYVLYDPEGDPVAATFFDYSPDGGGSWYPATPASSSPAPLTRTSPSGETGTFIWDAGADDALGDEVLFRVRVAPVAPIAPAQRGTAVGVSPPFRIKALDCYWPVGAKILGAPEHVAIDEEVTLQAYLESASGAIHYLWDFGDGVHGSGIEVTHRYQHNGVFTVTLAVEGEACPIARPAYARTAISVGTGIPDRIIYLPLVLRGYEEGGMMAAARPSRPFRPQTATQVAAQQVTNFSLGVNSQPAISGDGSRVVFWSTWPGDGNQDGSIEIILADVRPDGSVEYTAVTSSTGSILGGFNLAPSISRDGSRVAFFSDRDLTGENEDRNFEVFLAEVDGNGNVALLQVTKTARGLNVLPEISGDGRYLAFVSNQNLTGENEAGKTEVFRAEVGAGDAITLTQITHSDDEVNDQPTISYDGRYIAFVAARDNGRELRLAEVGTGGAVTVTTITAEGDVNERPAISDDGARIVFISNRTGVRQVFLAERNNQGGFDISQITTDGSDKDQPAISADGTRAAYVAVVGAGERRLHLYDLVDKGEVDTQAGDRVAYPAFNTDGTTVAFISDGDVLLREYPLADLRLSKRADKSEVQVGDQLLYTLRITNTGPSAAHSLLVTDYLPPGVTASLPMTLSDYTDDDNDGEGFGGGTHYGTVWDDGGNWLTMNASDNPFALPDNGGDVDSWLDMSGNVLLLHLDEPGGSTTFADTSSRGNDGVCYSSTCPQASDGKLGGGMEFDGGDDYIAVSDDSSLDLNAFTIGVWV
ncbi:MAG TPA: PKD domain-containing protein, partial [Anaerolineae bacterium]|nr:PKD domain-containing protein [Anaerolineae bacterium]